MSRLEWLIGASAAAMAAAASPASADAVGAASPPPSPLSVQTPPAPPPLPMRAPPPPMRAPPPPTYTAPPSPPLYAPPPPIVRQPEFPRPAVLRIGFISEEDYPVAALREEAEGMVTVTYVIGANGRVESCLVSQSSGNTDLDHRSCALIMERFVFMPALDAKGRPTSETRRQRIRWELPDTDPPCGDPEAERCVPAPPAPPGPPPWLRAPAPPPPPPPETAQKPR